MEYNVSDIDNCVPNIYKFSFNQYDYAFNSLAYSLSVVQNDDKEKIVKKMIDNNPQPLYLFKDAMLNMNQQLNNKLPSQYHHVTVNWNNNVGQYNNASYQTSYVQGSVYG